MTAASRLLLVALHFVCPLLFFTDLTRNPYVTQIALLNIGLLAAALLRFGPQLARGELRLPRTPLDLPLAFWLGVCVLSWLVAYWGHAPHYRESMRSEGLRAFLFQFVNAALVFVLASDAADEAPEEPGVRPGRWAVFALAWGGLWALFPQLRAAAGPLASAFQHAFDPYGALLWAGGLAAALWLARGASVHAVWHTALTVGVLASGYAVAQYFSLEFLWPRVLNPYGGRSVSTFGNPNFMSSYQVMLLPLAAVYYFSARERSRRVLYAAAFLLLEAGLLCSLTRSSWAGAAAALAPLALSGRLRRRAREDLEFHGLIAAAAVLMLLFWPQSNMGGYVSSVIGRLTEVGLILKPAGDLPYSPWFQRVLIWLCSWTMGAESPLIGKGFGLFELFYPFYQGHYLDAFDFFRIMRTHANNSHNELLEAWSQTGILGLGALLLLWLVFFRAAWSFARPEGLGPLRPAAPPADAERARKGKEPPDSERVWILAAAAGVLGMLVDNLLNVSLHFAVPGFLFWWQAGTALGLGAREHGAERLLRLPPPAKAAAPLALALACAWGSWQWVRYWNREVNYFIGFKLMRREDFARSVAVLRAAYDWHPREVNNNYELANAYARSERNEEAVWAYREALKANAGYDEIYFNLASVLVRLGRRDEALALFRTAWAINPLSEQIYTSFSTFLLGEPDPARQVDRDPERRREAIALLERATHFFPGELSYRNNLGYLYSLEGNFAQAEASYAAILRRRPDMAVAERNLRASLAQSKNPPPAVLEQLEEFRRLEGLLQAKDYGPRALALSRQAVDWFPDSTAALFYRGNLELLNGDLEGAARTLRAVVAREPGNVPARLNLGEVLVRLGRRPEAAESFRAALGLDPANERAKAALAALN